VVSKARKAAAQASYQQGKRKNFIYNGDMEICQRSTSVSSLGNGNTGYHVQDRYQFAESGAPNAEVTMSKSTTAPDGFASSLKLDCTTASGTVAAGDLIYLAQIFEGQDLQSINKGDAQAKAVTVSFWVNTTKTGTYILSMYDNDNNRSCSQSYTVSSGDTWEYKTVTFPPDTTGAYGNDNAASLYLLWGLVAGTDWTSGSLATAWESNNNPDRFTGQVDAFDSTSNNFHLTGIQMELGNTATEFQYESFKESLSRCQRYFMAYGPSGTDATDDFVVIGTGLAAGTTISWIEINPPTPMRTRPSATFNNVYVFDANNRFMASITYFSGDEGAAYRSFSTIWIRAVNAGGTTNNTTGRGAQLYTNAATDSYFWLSAEL